MARHGDLSAVRKNICGYVFKPLDKTEDIIPATAVEARHVIFQLVKNLIHFKGGRGVLGLIEEKFTNRGGRFLMSCQQIARAKDADMDSG